MAVGCVRRVGSQGQVRVVEREDGGTVGSIRLRMEVKGSKQKLKDSGNMTEAPCWWQVVAIM